MTAHIFARQLDAGYPATLSDRIVEGILRRQLGFNGVVISDDLQMGAIKNSYTRDAAVERAINAGVDVLLFANNSCYEPHVAERTRSLITSLVKRGRISHARITASYERIMTLKHRLTSYCPAQ
jgi:beta-N-acetylhexosaminidase